MDILKRTWRHNTTTTEARSLHVELEPLWVEINASSPDDLAALMAVVREHVSGEIAAGVREYGDNVDDALADFLASYARFCAGVAQDVARQSPILAALLLRQAIASDYTFAAPDPVLANGFQPSVDELCFRAMKIIDIARDYRPGVGAWIGLEAGDVQRIYSLTTAMWKSLAGSPDPALFDEARSLWRRLADSCRDVDSFLADEEANMEGAAQILYEYNDACSRPSPEAASLPDHLQLLFDPDPNPHRVGLAISEDTPDIIRAKLDVANIRTARAARHLMAGDSGAALRTARRGLEEAFNNSSWYFLTETPNPLLPLAEIRLTSIYVEARSRMGRLPAIDQFAQAHLERFTYAHTANWDVEYESAEYQQAWPWQDQWSLVEDRFQNSPDLPVEGVYANELTHDLITRTVAFGGIYDNARGLEHSPMVPSSRRKFADDEFANIQRGIDALHDRLDAPIKSIIEIRETAAALLTIVGAAPSRRKDQVARFLKECVPHWGALTDQTQEDVYQAELGFRAIIAGEVSETAARQVANALGVAFEREQRRNPGAILPNSGAFWDLRHRADHPDEGGFGCIQLEHMRSFLLGIGTETQGIMALLAAAAQQRKRR